MDGSAHFCAVLHLDLRTLPVLTTSRLVLRELRAGDAPALFAMRSDPVAMEHVRRPVARTLADAEAVIALIEEIRGRNEGAQWVITLKNDDTFIGLIGLWRMIKEHHRAELGYMLARAHWGKGLMTEAIMPVLEHGFRVFGCHSVEAHTDPRNLASMRVLEKCGFVREAHLRENIFWNGVFSDTVVFSKLAR